MVFMHACMYACNRCNIDRRVFDRRLHSSIIGLIKPAAARRPRSVDIALPQDRGTETGKARSLSLPINAMIDIIIIYQACVSMNTPHLAC